MKLKLGVRVPTKRRPPFVKVIQFRRPKWPPWQKKLKCHLATGLQYVTRYLGVVISLAVLVANCLLFLRNFRRSLFKLFKGDKTFILTGQLTSNEYMFNWRMLTGAIVFVRVFSEVYVLQAQSLRFMGYFIACNVWGFVVVFVIVETLCTLDGMAFELLSKTDRLGELVVRMLEISLYPVTVIVLFYGQTFIARRFLLQKKIRQSDANPPLAVDNRKFYNVFNYYMMFVNVAVGFVSCLVRTASSFILGLFHIGRLDKNLFMSGWYEKDGGYAAYVGMLHVEYTHNHPALRVFCSMLWDTALEKRRTPVGIIEIEGTEENSPFMGMSGHARSDEAEATPKRRIINRWNVAYTLVRNQSLICLRRHHPHRPEMTQVPEEEDRPSQTSGCLRLAPVIGYKVAVASPLIIIGVMVGIPVLTYVLFMSI